MQKRVVVYRRSGDGVYFIPEGVTTQGFAYQTDPFEYLPDSAAESADVWAALQRPLHNTGRIVPHPAKWGETRSWYLKANVATYRAFAAGAKALGVTRRRESYEIRILRWDGKGFEGKKEDRITFDLGQETDCAEFLRRALL